MGGWRKISSFGPNAADAAAGQHEQLFTQPVGFFDVVSDEERGALVGGDRFLQKRFHLAAQVRVQGRERFIEQQSFRLDGKCTRECDALLFASGKLVRVALLESRNVRPLNEILYARGPIGGRQVAQAESDVLSHGAVRKKRVVLEEQAEAAFARG